MAEMDKSESTKIDIPETSTERKGKAPLLGTPAAAAAATKAAAYGGGRLAGGKYKKGVAIFDLILRIAAAAGALGSTVSMGTAEQTLPFFTQFFQFQASYDDLTTFT